MGKTIVITNRKGGCGKSVTAANLGVGLARQGKKVLLIDTDNQHSLTVSMGVSEPDKLPITLSTVIADIIAKKTMTRRRVSFITARAQTSCPRTTA